MIERACQCENVEIRRGGAVIVPSFSLTMPSGRLFGLIGPSGSGKTTIMRAMMGLGAIHAGAMSILGHAVGSAQLRECVGYLPQNGGVWPDLTARESLRFMARVYGVELNRVDELLALMHLTQMADRPVATLSGGQARRVALAMAIVNRPEFLVLDEPTVGLDPRMRSALWQEFRTWATGGSTVVISTHVMQEAEWCDEVAVILAGRVIAQGSPQELIASQHADGLDEAVLRLFEQEAPDEQ